MQVAATGVVAEHVGPLIEAFTARDPGLEVAVERSRATMLPSCSSTGAPTSRSAAAPGPRTGDDRRVPFLRARWSSWPRPGIRWLASERSRPQDSRASAGCWVRRGSTRPPARGCFSPGRDQPTRGRDVHEPCRRGRGRGRRRRARARRRHAVVEEVRRGSLIRVDVSGTPMGELWHASTLGLGRALPAALALQRFATSSDATQAISSGRAGTMSSRMRPGCT